MSIQRIVNLNSINAKNRFDFDYLISKNENLVDTKYKVDNNSIIFIFDAKEEQLLDRTSLTVYEKLIVLLNALDLYELNNYIDFSLSPSNLVFQGKLNVSILQRDVNYGQGNNFLIKWKALLGALFINGCEYQALVDGGFSVLKSNSLTNKIVELQDIDEIRITLEQEIKLQKQHFENDCVILSKKKNKINRLIKIILSVLLVASILSTSFVFYKLNKYQKINELQTSYIQNEYSHVIYLSKKININKMSKNDKFIIAFSYVKLESLPEDISNKILNNININSNDNFLNYWVYLAQDNFSGANNQAMILNDQNLLVYSYLKEIEFVNNSDDYSSDEKQSKIKDLEGKIKDSGFDMKGQNDNTKLP